MGDPKGKVKRVEIELDAIGRGTVLVDGTDLAGLTRKATIITEAGKLTTVVLTISTRNGVKFKGEADVSAIFECPHCGLKNPYELELVSDTENNSLETKWTQYEN